MPANILERVSKAGEVRNLWRRAMNRNEGSIHDKVVAELELKPEYTGAVDEIPARGNTVQLAASDPNQRYDPLRGVSFAGPQRVGAHFSLHAARVDPVAARHAPFL